jgi:hypothetical protein
MKKFSLFLFSIISVIIVALIIIMHQSQFSKDAIVGKRNLENLEHIHLGMDSIQVKEIMGEPEFRNRNEQGIFFNYRVPPGLSIYCAIGFNSQGKVNFINPNEKELKELLSQ